MKETLILIKQIDGIFSLQDAYRYIIGRFQTQGKAIQWCKENGYRLRNQNGKLLI